MKNNLLFGRKGSARAFQCIVFFAVLLIFPTGRLLAQSLDWVRQISNSGAEEIITTCRDRSNNFIVSGLFTGTTNFAAPGQFPQYLSTTTGQYETFIAKYNSDGLLIWVKSIGGPNAQSILINCLETRSDNSIVAGGSFSGLVDFDPGSGQYQLNSYSLLFVDGFILQLDSNGAFVDVDGLGSQSLQASVVGFLKIDNQDNIIAVGSFQGTMDLDLSLATYTLTSGSDADMFVVKYSSNLSLNYCFKVGGQFDQFPSTLSLDNNANIYLSFSYNSIIDVDPSSSIYLTSPTGDFSAGLVKYSSSGQFLSFSEFNGSDDVGITDVHINNNRILISGGFSGSFDLDPGLGNTILTSGGSMDAFIGVFNLNMMPLAAHAISGTMDQFGGIFHQTDKDEIYLFGAFEGTVDLDLSPATNFFLAGSTNDGYLLKFDTIGNYQSCASLVCNHNFIYRGITSDTCGNILLTGLFTGQLDCDMTNGTFQFNSNNTLSDALLMKYNSYGCSITGLADYIKPEFIVFPNPAKSGSNIVVKIPELIEDVEIIDINGRLVYHQQIDSSETEISFVLPDAISGLSLILVRNRVGKVYCKKVVLND